MSDNLSTRVDAIIAESKQEETYPAGTLNRLALTLKRTENKQLAEAVASFTEKCSRELEFFRRISQFSQGPHDGRMKKFQDFVKARFTNPLYKKMTFDSPFAFIEGVATPENAREKQLSGPFFIAVAGDFSEGNEWWPHNKSYLIYPFVDPRLSDKERAASDEFELHVMSDNELKGRIAGEYGKSDAYRISLCRPHQHGTISALFEAVVEDMAKFAFGPHTSPEARNAFALAVKDYVEPTATPLHVLHGDGAALLSADAPTLALAGTR